MKPKMIIALAGCGISCLWLLVSQCVFTPTMAGNGSQTPNSAIVGMIYELGGNEPARGDSVVLRSYDYLANLQRLSKRRSSDTPFVRQTRTDDSGRFCFSSIPNGSYCIEAHDCGYRVLIEVDSSLFQGDTIKLPPDTLKAAAKVQGKLIAGFNSTETYVRAYGLDVIIKVGPDSAFTLENLPEGNLRLLISVIINNGISLDTIVKVDARAGVDTLLSLSIINTKGQCVGFTSKLSKVDRLSYPIFMDNDALYYLSSYRIDSSITDFSTTLISKVDKITGETTIRKFESLEYMRYFFLEGEYCFVWGLRDHSVYRIPKAGGAPELAASFDSSISELKADGDKMYVTFHGKPGLFLYTISDGTMAAIVDDAIAWFDCDEHFLFWAAQRDSAGVWLTTIRQMPRNGGAIHERAAEGRLRKFRMMGDFIYYRKGEDKALMRFNKGSDEAPTLVTPQLEKFNEDDGYVVAVDVVYVSNCNGELWKIPLNNSINGAVMLDKWGPYDDDDFSPWVGSDGSALYWIAGPDVNVIVSDDDAAALLKTRLDSCIAALQ